jgi:hypothetical protein
MSVDSYEKINHQSFNLFLSLGMREGSNTFFSCEPICKLYEKELNVSFEIQ